MRGATQAGGCCDCGDPDAWDYHGFCHKHGLDNRDPLQDLPQGMVPPRWRSVPTERDPNTSVDKKSGHTKHNVRLFRRIS